MKRFLTGLIFLTGVCTAQGQTLETGVAINATHLWQSFNVYPSVSRTEGLGMSIMARYQNPHAFFLLKNNEVGLEYNRGGIWMSEHTGPSMIGGDYTGFAYRSASITLNNNFVNFGTISKGFQVSLGVHYNFKIISISEGVNVICTYHSDTLGHHWADRDYYSLDGINNQYLRRFNMGPTMGIAFRPFDVGKLKLRCRYDINTTLVGDLKDGMLFNCMMQRITLSLVWADLKSNRNSEKSNSEK